MRLGLTVSLKNRHLLVKVQAPFIKRVLIHWLKAALQSHVPRRLNLINITEQATVQSFECALIRREENRDTEKRPLGHRTNIHSVCIHVYMFLHKQNQLKTEIGKQGGEIYIVWT